MMTSEPVTSASDLSGHIHHIDQYNDNDMTNGISTSSSTLPMTPPYTPSQQTSAPPITDQLVRQRKKCKLNSLLDKIKFKAQQSGANICLSNGDAFLPLIDNSDKTPPSSNPPPDATSPRITDPNSASNAKAPNSEARRHDSNSCEVSNRIYGIDNILSSSFSSRQTSSDANKPSHNIFFAEDKLVDAVKDFSIVQSSEHTVKQSTTDSFNCDNNTNHSSPLDCCTSNRLSSEAVQNSNISIETENVNQSSKNDSQNLMVESQSPIELVMHRKMSIDSVTSSPRSPLTGICNKHIIQDVERKSHSLADFQIPLRLESPKINGISSVIQTPIASPDISISDESIRVEPSSIATSPFSPSRLASSPIAQSQNLTITPSIGEEIEEPNNKDILNNLTGTKNDISDSIITTMMLSPHSEPYPISNTEPFNISKDLNDKAIKNIQSLPNSPIIKSPPNVIVDKLICDKLILSSSNSLEIVKTITNPTIQTIIPTPNLFPIPSTNSMSIGTKLPISCMPKINKPKNEPIPATPISAMNHLAKPNTVLSENTIIAQSSSPKAVSPPIHPSLIVYEDSLDQTINEVAYNLNRTYSPDRDDCSELSLQFSEDKINSVEYEDKNGQLKLVFRKSPNDSLSSVSSKSEYSTTSTTPSQHVCKQCGFDAKRRALYRKHLASEHALYLCAHCPYITGSGQKSEGQTMLNEHVATVHPEKSGRKKCRRCQRVVPHCEVDRHESICTGESPVWTCELCNRSFRFESQLRQHARAHTAGTIAPNEQGSEFVPGAGVRMISQRKRIHRCEYCNYSSSVKASMVKHTKTVHRTHGDNTKFVSCPDCDKLFYTALHMEKHQETHINNGLAQVKQENDKVGEDGEVISPSHPCHFPECKQNFRTQHGARQHFSMVHARGSHLCTVEGCPRLNEPFTTRAALNHHTIEVHSAITPGSTAGLGKEFKCTHENCTQAFIRKSHLTKHEQIHLGKGDKKQYCTYPECTKTFRSVEKLEEHLRKHERQKKCAPRSPVQIGIPPLSPSPTTHSCTKCSFACTREADLLVHIGSEHPATMEIKVEPTQSCDRFGDVFTFTDSEAESDSENISKLANGSYYDINDIDAVLDNVSPRKRSSDDDNNSSKKSKLEQAGLYTGFAESTAHTPIDNPSSVYSVGTANSQQYDYSVNSDWTADEKISPETVSQMITSHDHATTEALKSLVDDVKMELLTQENIEFPAQTSSQFAPSTPNTSEPSFPVYPTSQPAVPPAPSRHIVPPTTSTATPLTYPPYPASAATVIYPKQQYSSYNTLHYHQQLQMQQSVQQQQRLSYQQHYQQQFNSEAHYQSNATQNVSSAVSTGTAYNQQNYYEQQQKYYYQQTGQHPPQSQYPQFYNQMPQTNTPTYPTKPAWPATQANQSSAIHNMINRYY